MKVAPTIQSRSSAGRDRLWIVRKPSSKRWPERAGQRNRSKRERGERGGDRDTQSQLRRHAFRECQKAVRIWEGQFKTLKCHLEYEIDKHIYLSHPILQWAACWAAQIIVRWAVRRHCRTSFEYAKGYKTKTPVARFGEQLLRRERRGGVIRYDPKGVRVA